MTKQLKCRLSWPQRWKQDYMWVQRGLLNVKQHVLCISLFPFGWITDKMAGALAGVLALEVICQCSQGNKIQGSLTI